MISITIKGGAGGSRGAVAPPLLEKKNPRSRYIMNYSLIL